MSPRRPRYALRAKRAVAGFDRAVEARIEPCRGDRTVDRVMYAASALGDFSLAWHLLNTARGLPPDRRPEDVLRVAAILAAESAIVNQGVKRAFNRGRPAWDQVRPLRLRRPRTSSFPSGHASSAVVAAAVLSERDPAWPLYVGVAALIASSRVYVKVHHPSDVLAGAAVGAVLAVAARRLWPRR